ncbi:MAG: hypothetical protein WB443_05845 [Nitrososphaeraceae archaeon]
MEAEPRVSLGDALSDFIKESKKSDSGSITILEALTTILPGWDECLVNNVEEVLREKEIRIMTSSPVALMFVLVVMANQRFIHLLPFGLQELKDTIYW